MNEKVILYSTGCPKCNVLKTKLTEKGIQFDVIEDVDLMQQKGFMEAPMLEVGESIMNFSDAIAWMKYSNQTESVGTCESCKF